MSLATNSTHVLAHYHQHDDDDQYYYFPTAQFCALLENAVKYMQTDHKSGLPLEAMGHDETRIFLNQLRSAIHAGRWYMLACVVLLLYEYMITFEQEVELIWKRNKLSLVGRIFFINRYLPLATYLFVVISVEHANSSQNFCINIFAHIPPAMIVFCEAAIGVLRIVKIRALWKDDLNRTFGILVVLVYATDIALAIACAVAVQGIGPLFGRNEMHLGCFLIFQAGSMPRLVLHWFANIAFNTLIFGGILRKSLSIRVLSPPSQLGLSNVVLRDSAVLFGAVIAVNIANLVMLLVFPYWNAINWSFANIANVILTSRLFFNLRAQLDPPGAMTLAEDAVRSLQVTIMPEKTPARQGSPVSETFTAVIDIRDRDRAANIIREALEKEGLSVSIIMDEAAPEAAHTQSSTSQDSREPASSCISRHSVASVSSTYKNSFLP